MDNSKLQVSEIFYTIQGEGPDLGVPIIFIRLVGCNLHCSWCDSKYTWDWANPSSVHTNTQKFSQEKETKWMTVDQVMEMLHELDPNNFSHLIVVTGGNPLIHQKTSGFKLLLTTLVSKGYLIEMEDNGTIIPDDYILSLDLPYYHITPKLSTSGNSLHSREHRDVIEKYIDIAKNGSRVVFKYVVSTKEDFEEVQTLVEKYGIDRKFVWIMPKGISSKELMDKSELLAELSKCAGFNFTPRLHIMLWGNERGV